MSSTPPCRLCGKEAPLRDSHLIPNAIVRRFYETSPTGGARAVASPNKREQSFLHKPFLCEECEQRFDKREDRWMRDVDQRFVDQLPWSFECVEDHRYFAASLAWRVLAWDWPDGDNTFTENDREFLAKSETSLRRYLLNDGPAPDGPPTWLHLVTAPDAFTGAPLGLNVYLRGSLDIAVNAWDDSLYCYANCGGYIVAMVIAIDSDFLITWTLGTELKPGRRVHVDPNRFPEDPGFWGIIIEKARVSSESTRSLSARQSDNVKKRVDALPRPDLRRNPHVLATLMDYLNQRRNRGL